MRATICVFVLLACAPVAAQSTWIVNAGGGGDFTDIPPAIAAAAPGDRIVVEGASTYSAFVVDRGVDVEAAAGAITPTIEVVGLPAAQRARVAGFQVQRQGGVLSVSVRNCEGPVLLVDLVEFGPAFQTSNGKPGLEVLDSARVFVDRGTFLGQPGTSGGGAGLDLRDSQGVFVGATFVGGVNVGTASLGNDGRPGIYLWNSHAFIGGVSATAGPASQGNLVGGDGGHGVSASSNSLAIVVGASQLVATPGGWGSWISGPDGYAASGPVRYTADCVLTGGVYGTTLIPSRPSLSAPPSVTLSSNLTVLVQGDPDQLVGLAADLAFGYAPSVPFDGALVLTPNLVFVAVLQLDALGAASWGFIVPNVPEALHQNVFFQGIALVGADLVLLGPRQTRTQ